MYLQIQRTETSYRVYIRQLPDIINVKAKLRSLEFAIKV